MVNAGGPVIISINLRPEDRAKKYDFGNLDPLGPHTIVWTSCQRTRSYAADHSV